MTTPTSLELLVLLANALATWLVCGVIWFVQLVHYPLFSRYDSQHFRAAMGEHQRGTSRVVLVPMLAESLTSLALLVFRPPEVPAWMPWAGALLDGVWGFSTALVQIPLHQKLSEAGFDAAVHRRLVMSNWVRTAAWTGRAVLCGTMLAMCKF